MPIVLWGRRGLGRWYKLATFDDREAATRHVRDDLQCSEWDTFRSLPAGRLPDLPERCFEVA